MTKQHFEALAKWFNAQLQDKRFTNHNGSVMVSELSMVLRGFNPHFDGARYREACLKDKEEAR